MHVVQKCSAHVGTICRQKRNGNHLYTTIIIIIIIIYAFTISIRNNHRNIMYVTICINNGRTASERRKRKILNECSDWFYAVHSELDVYEHFADKVNILMMLTTSVCVVRGMCVCVKTTEKIESCNLNTECKTNFTTSPHQRAITDLIYWKPERWDLHRVPSSLHKSSIKFICPNEATRLLFAAIYVPTFMHTRLIFSCTCGYASVPRAREDSFAWPCNCLVKL